MRVTQSMIANQTLRHIQSNYGQVSKYQDQLATGKKFSRASQDPVAATSGMSYRTQVREIEQFQRNISSANTWMETSDQSLYDLNQGLQRVRELTAQAANDTYDEKQREAVAEEVAQIIEHIADVGNTKVNNKYIFNGTNTEDRPINKEGFDLSLQELEGLDDLEGAVLYYEGTSYVWSGGNEGGFYPQDALDEDGTELGQPAFTINEGNLVTDGQTTVDTNQFVLFSPDAMNLNNNDFNLELMKGVEMPVNVDGTKVFNHEMIGELKLLEKALKNGDVEASELSSKLDVIDDQMDKVLTAEAQVGARQNRLYMNEMRMDQQYVTATRIMSDNEDVDIAEAIMNLVTHESVLNASLAAGARILQPSLVDFLR